VRPSFASWFLAALLSGLPSIAAPDGRRAAPIPAHRAAPLEAEGSKEGAGRLVLLVVVDGLRYQDVLLLAREFGPAGFAGLGRPAQLRYDTAVTETAADHATLSTGAWSALHGIVGNKWLEEGRARAAIDDPACPLWERPGDGKSASGLQVPTVGDALKLGTAGRSRVVSVGNKDRVALLLAGRGADFALFWDDRGGRFTSTTCYAPEAPPWVTALRQEHPIDDWLDYVWTPSRPLGLLGRYADLDAPGVNPKSKLGERFPHAVGQRDPGPRLYYALRQTPAATTLALQAADAAIRAYGLGERGETDLLLLGLSAIDGVGHQFGAHAPERIDALLRLHDELGRFLAALGQRLGGPEARRLAIVLTADHGLQPIPAQSQKLRVGGRLLSREALAAKVEQALTARFGTAGSPWVELFDPPYASLSRSGGVEPDTLIHLAAQALREEPGLWRVVETARALESPGDEPSFVRNALFAGRSGDLLLIPRPLFMLLKAEDGADHGTPWNDDALVPFYARAPGWSMRPGYRGGVLSATQVAPTLAALLEVSPPGAAFAEPALERTQGPPAP
jgi:hypothetical protein